MADGTKIEWTDATWNPVTGCSVVSPGCTNCYAMRLAGTRMRHHPSRQGLTVPSKAGPVWNGTVRFNENWLDEPLRWRRPRRIFVCAHGDLFHESVPDEWIDRVFAVMALAPQHQFQVLTKRADRMRAYCTGHIAPRIWRAARDLKLADKAYLAITAADRPTLMPLPNVWLGVSVEDQQRACERIPMLLTTPAAVRWLSCEPLLGRVNLRNVFPDATASFDALTGKAQHLLGMRQQAAKIDWVVAGGESGPGARPMHPDWARSLRDQCASANVPFLFKQWGSYAPLPQAAPVDESGGCFTAWPDGTIGDGHYLQRGGCGTSLYHGTKSLTGRHLDGQLHDGFPQVAA